MLRAVLAALLMTTTFAMAEDFPRRSVEGALDGDSKLFAGNWAMAAPASPSDPAGEVVTDCDAPVVITALADHMARFHLPTTGYTAELELSEAIGGTRWKADQGPGFFSAWAGADSFYLFEMDMMGRPSWRNPDRLTRC